MKISRTFKCKHGVLLYVDISSDTKYDNCITLGLDDCTFDFMLIDITFNIHRGIKPKHVLTYGLTATTLEKMLDVLNGVDCNVPSPEAMAHINMSKEIIKDMNQFQESLYTAIEHVKACIKKQ